MYFEAASGVFAFLLAVFHPASMFGAQKLEPQQSMGPPPSGASDRPAKMQRRDTSDSIIGPCFASGESASVASILNTTSNLSTSPRLSNAAGTGGFVPVGDRLLMDTEAITNALGIDTQQQQQQQAMLAGYQQATQQLPAQRDAQLQQVVNAFGHPEARAWLAFKRARVDPSKVVGGPELEKRLRDARSFAVNLARLGVVNKRLLSPFGDRATLRPEGLRSILLRSVVAHPPSQGVAVGRKGW